MVPRGLHGVSVGPFLVGLDPFWLEHPLNTSLMGLGPLSRDMIFVGGGLRAGDHDTGSLWVGLDEGCGLVPKRVEDQFSRGGDLRGESG